MCISLWRTGVKDFYTVSAITDSFRWQAYTIITLHWRHNDHDGVSNHQPHGCLLNRLFRRTSKKTSKLRVTGLCVGNSPGPVNPPHKGPVTRKMFPFYDVIMTLYLRLLPPFGDRYVRLLHYICDYCLHSVTCIYDHCTL